MKRILTILIFLIGIHAAFAQKKEKVPTKAEIDAMMKQAEDKIKASLDQLSPEERKMVEEAMAKGKADVNGINFSTVSSEVKADFPKKQSAILNKMPKITTEAAYVSYLENLKAKANATIAKNIRDEVEKLLAKNSSDKTSLNNLPPLLLMGKNPKAAVYAALRVAELNKDVLLSQNNLAVVLHQTGYPQYALPLLEYLLLDNPLATLYNNAAQCYLSMGETQKAEIYFARCLSIDPQNYEAHCGTALILIKQDKTPQAIPHVQKAMKKGYSPVLEKLVDDNKMDLDFEGIRSPVTEYFNPNKYRAPAAAHALEDIRAVLAQREETTELMYKWGEKNREYDEKHADKIAKESVMQMNQRFPGMIGNLPFSRKARFMISESYKESTRLIAQTINEANRDKAKAMHESLQASIDKQYKEGSFGSTYDECLMLKAETEKYLRASAEQYDEIVRNTVFKHYDLVNQQLYWNKYLLNRDGYQHMFYGVAAELFTHLDEYQKFQVLTRPEWVLNHCEKVLQNPPSKGVMVAEVPDMNCPFKIKIDLGGGNLKMDCKGWEIEGGELVVLGIQKDYKTGELTMAFGLGANLPIPTFAQMGAKGQMFFKFDSDGAPIDCGMVFEAGADASVGTVNIEEKATATIGMVSGVHVNGVSAGQETAIFTLEP